MKRHPCPTPGCPNGTNRDCCWRCVRSRLRPDWGRAGNGLTHRPRRGKVYKGVAWNRRLSAYEAVSWAGRAKTVFGRFDTAAEAARAYNRGIERLYPGLPKYLNPVP